jgi:hypothetical protein
MFTYAWNARMQECTNAQMKERIGAVALVHSCILAFPVSLRRMAAGGDSTVMRRCS